MVDYIGVSDIQRLVNGIGTGEFIERLAREIEADYRRWSEFEKSTRLASHSPVGVIELMPTSDGRLYSFKYVNGHPKNTAAGLLTVTAFGVLADVDTGYPLLLSELTITTALRTAATSALAAQWMARDGSRVMALIGNGAQAEFQAIAFHRMLGIRELRIYDVDPQATAKLERNLRNMSELVDLRVVRAKSIADACKGADIVTTVTADKCNAVILTPPMITPGMHLNAGRWRLPRQDRAARRRAAHVGGASRRRVRAAVAHRGRDPADARGLCRDAAQRRHTQRGDRTRDTGRDHDLRFGRLCARGLLRVALPAQAVARRAR
jgi:ornithine cyclodeaminase